MNTTKYDLRSNVSVTCEIGVIEAPKPINKIGHFKASGTYKPGSSGSNDAYHIYGMMAYAQSRFFNDYWIVDFSDLEYECGDEMDLLLGENFRASKLVEIKMAFVFGPKCIKSIATLDGMNETPETLLNRPENFRTLAEAYEYLAFKK